MASYKWVILHIVLIFTLAGCISKQPQPVIQPTQIFVKEQTVIPSPINTSTAIWCKDFNQANGIPFDSKLENSYILYKAFPLDNEGNGANLTWKFSMKDNSNKSSADTFPYPETKDGQYDDVNGFSLNSADGKHIAIWGHWYEESTPDGTYSLIIRNKESGQDIVIFRSGPAENIAGGWSPDGNYFVFTSYKNSDENNLQYYSLVYAVNADGTGLRQLTEKMYSELLERPRWSPDSKKIAIPFRGADGGMHIMIIIFQTGDMARYKVSPIIRTYSTNYGGWVEQNEMTWAPDNKWFAYISEHHEHNGLEILNTENGEIYCIENKEISGIDKLIWVHDNP